MLNKIPIREAILLLVAVLTLAGVKSARPWKRLRIEFLQLEQEQLASRLAEARIEADREVGELDAIVDRERQRLAGRGGELRQLARDLRDLRGKAYEARAWQLAKRNELALARNRYEQIVAKGRDSAAIEAEIQVLRDELREARKAVEGLAESEQAAADKLAALESDLPEAQDRRTRAYAEIEEMERRLAELGRGSLWRDLPVVGLFHPGLKVHEVSPAALDSAARPVDRCVTCHLAAPREGFDSDGWPPPFGSHPRQDLFVGETSPHPYEDFGCSVCHGGNGRATDFSRAGHLPASAEQEAEWTRKWGLRRQELPAEPILPRQLVETGCVSCHRDEPRQAPAASAGRRLILALGCQGCHPIARLTGDDLPKSGPSLVGIAGKTRPAWVYRWLEAPRDFRPTTWMPHFFHLENTRGEASRKRQSAEMRAIVTYLWERSRPVEYEDPPEGDAEAGRVLFESIGCTGCHLLDTKAERARFYPDFERLHGPNLARTGSKVTAAWLYAWLRDPSSYRADTPMPSLRLSEQRAADLVAYLMTSRDAEWENLELPPVDAEVRGELIKEHLQKTLTIEESAAAVSKEPEPEVPAMSERERNLYLGERTIARYGCHGCHDIAGFEDAEPVGGDLSTLGRRPLADFDFGRVAGIARTRHDWLRAELLRPRLWDQGREREYGELLTMPDYGMSEREAAAVLVNLLGWKKPPAVDGAAPDRALSAGRRIVARYGCRGCHRLEGRGGESFADRDAAPPDLAMEGARVTSSWLFSYLHDPGRVTIRPWLTVRMPTFHWRDAEINALVGYFVAQSGAQLFAGAPPPANDVDLLVGRTVFDMLQCNRCHQDISDFGGLGIPRFAPPYRLARQRLRPWWVTDWILDPRRWDPDTEMPPSFQTGDGAPSSSFLVGSINAPMFEDQRERLLAIFDSEETMVAYLSDPLRVASALRAHLWSLSR